MLFCTDLLVLWKIDDTLFKLSKKGIHFMIGYGIDDFVNKR
jgi:hypothetical protein